MGIFNRNQTIKPLKKVAPDSSRQLLMNKYQNTLSESSTNAILFESVKLPNGEDWREWVAIHTIDYYNKINMLFSDCFEHCTAKICPQMTAGSTTYLWRDGKKYKKPTEIPANEYCELSLDWIEEALNNEILFPSNFATFSNDLDKDFRHTIKEITKRIFRIYAHIFFSHYEAVKTIGEAQILFGFKLFLAFGLEFSLIKEKELEVMREWIESNLNIDIHKYIKKKKKESTSDASDASSKDDPNSLDVKAARNRSKSKAVSPMDDSRLHSNAYDASKQHFVSTLSIEVVEAKNLTGKDLSGTSDPYVTIEFEENISKTAVVWKQLCPKWNERFAYVVNDEKSTITVTVYDENLLRKDSVIGKCEIPLQSFLDEEEHESWFTLMKENSDQSKGVSTQGAVHLRVKYTSSESSAMKVISKICNIQYYNTLQQFLLHLPPHTLTGLFDFVSIPVEDKMYKSILQILCYSSDVQDDARAYNLLCYLIQNEVQKCQHHTTLFRSNSLASKFVAAYFKIYGQDYLRRTLYSHITNICLADEDTEVDPSKMSNPEEAESHMNLLLQYCQKIFDAIVNSAKQLPLPLRKVLQLLKQVVSNKYEQDGTISNVAIGGLFFLRFVCPAILSPTSNLLYKGIAPAQSLKTLVRITKVLQVLANGVEFGVKESYMNTANQFIEKNRGHSPGQLHYFFDQITLCNDSPLLVENSPVSNLVDKFQKTHEQKCLYSLFTVHSHFVNHLERLKIALQELATKSNPEEVITMPPSSQEALEVFRHDMEETVMNLEIVIKQVGPVPSIQKQNRSKVSKSVFKVKKPEHH